MAEGNIAFPPLLNDVTSPSPSSSSAGSQAAGGRTGTVRTAIAHIITGVIGSGVLSLAWSMAQLGWIAGPICMVVFAIITILSSNILCDCYRHPQPDFGDVRNKSYAKAVKSYLGVKSMWVIGVFLYESLYGLGIAYTIAAGISMRAILQSNCYHEQGHDAPCEFGGSLFMLLFGAVQLALSQIPNFHNMEYLSIMAAVMSFAYTFIALGLGFAKVIENGQIKGTYSGLAASSPARKVFLSLQALGDIAFSYNYNTILFEIQDTLRAPPQENKTMKKASVSAILITSFFFLCCGCFGYAAFGDDTPGNLLTGFGFYEPYWLVDIANVCLVLHLVGGYQIYSQPIFAAVQRNIVKTYPNCAFVNYEHPIELPFVPSFKLNLFRLSFRSAYVASTTALSILFPYFNEVLGVLGAFDFWPLVIYFPIQMYLKQNFVPAWSRTWILLQALSVFFLLCAISALVGSIEGLISNKF